MWVVGSVDSARRVCARLLGTLARRLPDGARRLGCPQRKRAVDAFPARRCMHWEPVLPSVSRRRCDRRLWCTASSPVWCLTFGTVLLGVATRPTTFVPSVMMAVGAVGILVMHEIAETWFYGASLRSSRSVGAVVGATSGFGDRVNAAFTTRPVADQRCPPDRHVLRCRDPCRSRVADDHHSIRRCRPSAGHAARRHCRDSGAADRPVRADVRTWHGADCSARDRRGLPRDPHSGTTASSPASPSERFRSSSSPSIPPVPCPSGAVATC